MSLTSGVKYSLFFTVAPVLQPRWYPFNIKKGQRLIWPTEGGVSETVDLRVYDELIFPCRVSGRPRAIVMWLFNDQPIEDNPELQDQFSIVEVGQGNSILTIRLENFTAFGTGIISGGPNELLGRNVIQCVADNAAEDIARGTVTLNGRS